MPVENVILPKLGVYTEDVVLSAWRVEEGGAVEAGAVVLEMETDKTTAEVEAETSGWLHRGVDHGATLAIGTVVGWIASTREEYQALVEAAPEAGATRTGPDTDAEPEPETAEDRPSPSRSEAGTDDTRTLASPRARGLLERLGFPAARLGEIRGTGPRGRILDRDVAAWAQVQSSGAGTDEPTRAVSPVTASAVSERIPLRGLRGTIATRMLSSLQTSAQLTSVLELDVKPIVDLRRRLAAETPPRRVGVTAIVVEVVAAALREHPLLNARIVEDEIEVLADVNVGVAVEITGGLVVPVVHAADRLPLTAIDARIADVAERARAGTLAPDDVAGATFTVSNGGIHDVDLTTAILDPPQVAILWIGRIRDRPVVAGDAIAIRPTLQACLTFDHRAIDGGTAAAFLTTLGRRVAALREQL